MASLGQQALTRKAVAYTSFEYDYRKKGAAAAAEALGAELSSLLKTLVVELSDHSLEERFVLLLMPGNLDASLRALARALAARGADLASERDAERVTGYQTGGIGPFGVRKDLPVLVDLSAVEHDRVYINGGRRGLLLGLRIDDLIEAAAAEIVDVAIDPKSRKPG